MLVGYAVTTAVIAMLMLRLVDRAGLPRACVALLATGLLALRGAPDERS